MGLIEALILGILQGLTEFLPISSTAHLRLFPELMGWDDPGASFTAVIQLGTLLAVLLFFRIELVKVAGAWGRSLLNRSARSADSTLGWAIVVGTIPIVVFGVLFRHAIERDLRSLYVVAVSLIGMGLLLLVAELVAKHRRSLDEVSMKDGLAVGLWQAIALIPGASRSGSTITGALFMGFDRATAARFSFLLSIPSVFAAALFSLMEHRAALTGPLLLPVVVANVASFVSGYAAIAFLMRFLQTRSAMPFVVYRVALGALILVLLGSGVVGA